MNLSLVLKDWRGAHDLTQPQAAHIIGCARESVSEWERGFPVAAKSRGLIAHALRLASDDPRIVAVKAAALPPIDAAQLATTLRAWRRTHRLTAAQAGRALRVHARTVQAWESRLQFPQPAPLHRALTVLAAPPAGDLGENGWHNRHRAHRDPQCSFGKELRRPRPAARSGAHLKLGERQSPPAPGATHRAPLHHRPQTLMPTAFAAASHLPF